MPITFTGLLSVLNRTLFTDNAPIVKRPLPLLTGNDLLVKSYSEIEISSGSFTSADTGRLIEITGSPDDRNNGTFPILEVLSSKRLILSNSNLNFVDYELTTTALITLVNDLRSKYNSHRVQSSVHGTNDTVNIVSVPSATSLNAAILLLNNIKSSFNSHKALITGSPPVHLEADTKNQIFSKDATNLNSATLLANELRFRFESHRQDLDFHLNSDTSNRISYGFIRITNGSGSYVGPFTWTLYDPRYGQIADNTSDVEVLVNGSPASIDAVFGLLGAVVLSAVPGPLDTVEISYDYIVNPNTAIDKLNTFEYLLNEDGNRGRVGIPGHTYRTRAHLVDPLKYGPIINAPFQAKKVGWKYKALERAYTASLNDPNTLLLNVPSNKLYYPVLQKFVRERTIRYDPSTLPNQSTDPWELKGVGTFTLSPGGSELTIVDSSTDAGVDSRPPFFSKSIDLRFESYTSAAFRCYIDEDSITKDGVFTGVGFGISDGERIITVGFIETDAVNLSSAIGLANLIKSEFDQHLVETGVHLPNDNISFLDVVDAYNLNSLIVLTNRIKYFFNQHISLGPNNIHLVVDTVNVITLSDCTNEITAILLINDVASKYNLHRTQTGIHYSQDNTNSVGLIKQIGILKNQDYPEFKDSWESYAVNWNEYKTYRLVRDENGDASIFLSGMVDPIIYVQNLNLPTASDVAFRVDPLHQVFFGAVGSESASTSKWAFIRANIIPVTFSQIGDNKSVNYIPNTIPELDPDAPWIAIGQSGDEKVVTSVLTLNSVSSATSEQATDAGIVSGDYRGYLRFEPILSDSTTLAIEFQGRVTHWTYGLDSESLGLFIDDGFLSTRLLFLQSFPVEAEVTGNISEPFAISAGDNLIVSVDNGPIVSVVFFAAVSGAVNICNEINSYFDFTFATPHTSGPSTFIRLTTQSSGSSSKIDLIGGSGLVKLGFSPGVYFGRDSFSEPKIAWFGQDFPDFDFPNWIKSGNQTPTLLDRTLRITDNTLSNYLSYTLSNKLFTSDVISSLFDWKMTSRMKVLSFQAGNPVFSGLNLSFCGVLINVDEGPSGKNIELHLAMGLGNIPYVSILSYNSSTGNLDSIDEYQFNWTDGQAHNYDIYTSKLSNLILVFADDSLLGTFPYSSLNSGVVDSSIIFGSGSNPISNADLRTSRSVVDWSYVSVFKDSKLSSLSSLPKKYVGIYAGGDETKLDSYYVHEIDWTNLHTYRLIRDPVSSVSLYVDGGEVPVISINYDSIKLPPSSTSFLNEATDSRSVIAFGSFSTSEVVRSKWNFIRYSLGKLTLTDRRVPPGHIINRHNVIASKEHSRTKLPHNHYGFTIYSGGTPTDDFLSDPSLEASTILGERTPPVPMTQNLEDRGGLVQTVTQASGILTVDFVNEDGYLSSFENDEDFDFVGPVSYGVVVTDTISKINDFKAKYNLHRTEPGVHAVPDVINFVSFANAFNEATCTLLANEVRDKLNLHLNQAPFFHENDDTINTVLSPPATDFYETIDLIEEMHDSYSRGNRDVGKTGHTFGSNYHFIDDGVNFVLTPPAVNIIQAIALLNDIKTQFNEHRINISTHSPNDGVNTVVAPNATNLATAHTLALDIQTKFNAHMATGPANVHLLIDTVNTLPAVGPVTESSVISFSNSAKNACNSHFPAIEFHYGYDHDNYVFLSNVTTDDYFYLLNELKNVYNVHVADANLHLAISGAEILISPNAINLATGITLANEILTKFNVHLTAVGRHQEDDVNNPILSAASSNIETLSELIQEIKSKYNHHLINFGSHGKDDTINTITSPNATNLATTITLLNEIRTDYEFHRVSTIFHKQADSSHPITSPACSDLNTSISLANDLRNNISVHFSFSVHVELDVINIITGNAVDLATVISLSNLIKSSYNLHRIQTRLGHHIHGTNDTTNKSNSPSPIIQCIQIIDEFKIKFKLHRIRTGVHNINDLWNNFDQNLDYLIDPERVSLDSVYEYVLNAMQFFVDHGIRESTDLKPNIVHSVYDPFNTDSFNPLPSITNPVEVITYVELLKQNYNFHIPGVSFHLIPDNNNYLVNSILQNPLDFMFDSVVDIKNQFNRHFVKKQSHVKINEENLITSSNPVSTDTANQKIQSYVDILNEAKQKYELHRQEEGIHVNNDVVNFITSPDASISNFQTITDLATELMNVMLSHGIETGVHGSLVFIKLDAPDRVLYESMKFFNTESGTDGFVAPFIDDEAHGELTNTTTMVTTEIEL